MLSVSPGLGAWGLVTGMAMVKGGLSLPVALFMSLAVFSGSAQLAVVPLMVAAAPLWVIWATAVCVNLRFVIFSAQWRPFLKRLPRWQRVLMAYLSADFTYVLFMKRFPSAESADPDAVAHYHLGAVTLNWLSWQIPATAGVLLAHVIPDTWGLGFAGVLALVGLTCALLSDRVSVIAAVVAGGAAVAAFALPFKLHIVVAIAAGVCAALLFERRASPAIRG
ncbi:MAG: hypothetical protein RLZZ618_1628 [Pseudomonadota bacterium]